MRAFEMALEEGADALEMDVHITSDGVPIVMHDASLARTTGDPRMIAELTLDQLRELDAGARFSVDRGGSFPWRAQGIRVPTLDEVLQAFPSVPFIVELKSTAAGDAVRRTLLEHGAAGRCILMSFQASALDLFRDPPWLTGATSSEAQRLMTSALMRRSPGDVRYAALSLPERYHGFPIPLGLIAASARPLGIPVHVWPIDSPERALRLWRKGIAGIVTNYPAEIRGARDSG